MMIRNATLTLAGLGLVGMFALPAQAAPSVGAGLAAQTPSAVEKTAYYGQRCWRRHGKLYCRRYVRRAYPYAYYGNGWGPGYGYGPSFGLYFGGGGRGHWGGGHHGGHHGGHRR
jgi:hypothetical protein